MKQGRTLIELATELERQRDAKRDFISASDFLEMENDKLWVGESEFGITDLAHTQIAHRLDIPTKYYDRMREVDKELLSNNVNYWLNRDSSKKYLVRTLDGNARALLSDKYRPLDNVDLANIALPTLLESGAVIESCEVTESKLYIKAVTPKVQFDIKPGDTVQAGIIISNSEVGHGSLSVEPLIYRLVCSNGLIVNKAGMRKTHVGRGNKEFEGVAEFFRDETREADDRAFWMKVRDTLAMAFNTIGFEKIVDVFRESMGEKVEGDPVKVVEVTQKKFALSNEERNGVLTHFLQSGEMSKYGLVNAITRAAQDVNSYDRSVELEKLGGTVLELPKKDWAIIANAQSDSQ